MELYGLKSHPSIFFLVLVHTVRLRQKYFCLIFDFFHSNLLKLVYFWTKISNNNMGYFFPLNFNDFKFEVKTLFNLINKNFSSIVWSQYFIRCITNVCNILKSDLIVKETPIVHYSSTERI